MSHEKFKSCIEKCFDCAVMCNHCANACLSEKEVAVLTECIRLNHECAEICLFAVDAMSRGSEFSDKICRLCAEICDECARECGKHDHMEHCRKCAEACRACADDCRSMFIIAV